MRKYLAPMLASGTALSLMGCQETPVDSDTSEPTTEVLLAQATLDSPGSDADAAATINASNNRASITILANGLSEGTRGFHLHETGSCEAPDFKSAGGHLNPLGKAHGSRSEGGSHVGDLPNLETGTDGSATLTYTIDGTLDDIEAWLFDEDGTAVVIHEGADDYLTDPSGDAGARIACGVLQQPE